MQEDITLTSELRTKGSIILQRKGQSRIYKLASALTNNKRSFSVFLICHCACSSAIQHFRKCNRISIGPSHYISCKVVSPVKGIKRMPTTTITYFCTYHAILEHYSKSARIKVVQTCNGNLHIQRMQIYRLVMNVHQ